MQWKKDADKKYTDLCIYIDANIEKLRNPQEYPEIENTVYNYLWLLVKALAIKKKMFQNFEDYDLYSFYSANRLFFALRKNLWNSGKIVKGKLIRPIKSILNYTKTLLVPMKIEYQNRAYQEVLDEKFTAKKFDSFAFQQRLQESARSTQLGTELFASYVKDFFSTVPQLIDGVLKTSPFKAGMLEHKRLKISILLNCLNNGKLSRRVNADTGQLMLWKLPKSMSGYMKILMKEVMTEIKKEVMDCYSTLVVDDATAAQIVKYREGVDYEYGENN